MEITYLGHSSFKLKGKTGTIITDPFASSVGFSFPSASADMVTISHDHPDHNNEKGVSPTARRERPWIVRQAGEYEVAGISVFGHQTFHDDKKGEERGKNVVFSMILDGMNVVHLGDLGHTLTEEFIGRLGTVDVLLCPVGGHFTIDPEKATEVIQSIEPSFVIPMHYRTPKHDKMFDPLKTVEEFQKAYGVTSEPIKSLTVTTTMPEQTTLVILES
jgi:L-ascorbate metabolism protein UlaG (beta-lactamase superfamily)